MRKEYKDIVMDFRTGEIRGKQVIDIIRKRIDTPEELEERKPELSKWLKDLNCKHFIWGFYRYGYCLTKDGRMLELDLERREVWGEIPRFKIRKELENMARAHIIPAEEWRVEYAKLPVKIIGLEEIID